MSKVKITGNASGTGTLTIAAPNTNVDRTLTLPDADITLGGGVDGVDSDYTSGTAVKIDSSGNVGIGTSTPANLLHLEAASCEIRLKDTGASDYALVATDDDGTLSLYARSTNGVIDFRTQNVERMRIDSSGNLKFNSGYGSAATAYGCRAWVNFNGTGTVAIRESGGVSSVTDTNIGRYTVNLSVAAPDSNYATTITIGNNQNQLWVSVVNTTSYRLNIYTGSSYIDDGNVTSIMVR